MNDLNFELNLFLKNQLIQFTKLVWKIGSWIRLIIFWVQLIESVNILLNTVIHIHFCYFECQGIPQKFTFSTNQRKSPGFWIVSKLWIVIFLVMLSFYNYSRVDKQLRLGQTFIQNKILLNTLQKKHKPSLNI